MSAEFSENSALPASKFAPALSRPLAVRFGVPLLAVVLAALATRLLQAETGQKSPATVFFLAAVIFSTGISDLYVGICATLLAVVCYDYFFLPPFYSFTIYRTDAPTLLLFVLVALLINGVGGRLQARTRAADQRSQKLVQELTLARNELATLNSTISAISVSLEMPVVLATLQQQLMSQLHIRCGAVYVADEEGALSLKAAWGFREPLPQHWDELTFEAENAPLRCWKWEGRQEIVVALTANETLQGGLYLADLSHSDESNNKESNNKESNNKERYSSAFWTAMGRQIGVVIENARLYAQVSMGRERLQMLSRRLVQVQEAERQQIARELHDEIGQALTGLKLNLEMGARQPANDSQASRADALTMINDLMAHVRDLSLQLRPTMLDDLGLLPTLLWHFGRYSALTGIQVNCEHAGMDRRFPIEVESAAYRIVQEALTNVARHASVEQATVRLWATSRLLGVQIVDSGKGFDTLQARSRFDTGGLMGMEERATLLGGHLTLESTPRTGTSVTAELPLCVPVMASGVTGMEQQESVSEVIPEQIMRMSGKEDRMP